MELAEAKADAEAAEGSSTRATSPERSSPGDDETMLSDSTTAIEAAEARELDLRMLKRRESREYNNPSRSSSRASSSRASFSGSRYNAPPTVAPLNPLSMRGPLGTRARGMSAGSDRSYASGYTNTSGLTGDSVVEEDEDNFDDSPYSLSRKGSSIAEDDEEMDDAGDETFMQLPAFDRPPPTILLAPLPLIAKKRGSQSSFGSVNSLSLAPTPAESRRSSEATVFFAPPSARPEQSSFNLQRQPTPPLNPLPVPSQAASRRQSREKPTPLVLSNPSGRPKLFLIDGDNNEGSSSRPSYSPALETSKPPQQTTSPPLPTPLRIPIPPKQDLPSLQLSSSASSLGSSASSASRSSASSNDKRDGVGAPSKRTTYRNKTHRATLGGAPYTTEATTPHQTVLFFPPSPPRFQPVLSTDGYSSAMVQVPPTPSRMLVTTTAQPHSHSRSRSRSRIQTRSGQTSDEFEVGSLTSSASNSSVASGVPSSRSTSTSSITSGISAGSGASLTRRRMRGPPPLSSGMTPTVASFRHRMRHGSEAGSGTVPTPTTATTHVEARGWVTTSAAVSGRTKSSEVLTPMTARPS